MSANNHDSRINALYNMKQQKLASQKNHSDQFHTIIQKLSVSNNQKRRNLAAAITVAKQPGYFEYYEPPAEIRNLEESNVLKQLAQQISKLHREITQINEEIQQENDSKNASNVNHTVELTNLSQWFDIYGHPTHSHDDRLTTFVPNNKMYGGTSHYRPFKSVSMTMKKGRLI